MADLSRENFSIDLNISTTKWNVYQYYPRDIHGAVASQTVIRFFRGILSPHDPRVTRKFSSFFRSPLHAAAFNDQTECIQCLLKNNIEIDAADANGRTALMVAAEKGHTKTVGKDQSFV